MKRTRYIIPQICVVKLHQQPLMQAASNPIPRTTEEESDTNLQDEYGYWNL